MIDRRWRNFMNILYKIFKRLRRSVYRQGFRNVSVSFFFFKYFISASRNCIYYNKRWALVVHCNSVYRLSNTRAHAHTHTYICIYKERERKKVASLLWLVNIIIHILYIKGLCVSIKITV